MEGVGECFLCGVTRAAVLLPAAYGDSPSLNSSSSMARPLPPRRAPTRVAPPEWPRPQPVTSHLAATRSLARFLSAVKNALRRRCQAADLRGCVASSVTL